MLKFKHYMPWKNIMLNERFIAGAVCPSCKGMDKIVLGKEEFKMVMRCVACGFKHEMNTEEEHKIKEK